MYLPRTVSVRHMQCAQMSTRHVLANSVIRTASDLRKLCESALVRAGLSRRGAPQSLRLTANGHSLWFCHRPLTGRLVFDPARAGTACDSRAVISRVLGVCRTPAAVPSAKSSMPASWSSPRRVFRAGQLALQFGALFVLLLAATCTAQPHESANGAAFVLPGHVCVFGGQQRVDPDSLTNATSCLELAGKFWARNIYFDGDTRRPTQFHASVNSALDPWRVRSSLARSQLLLKVGLQVYVFGGKAFDDVSHQHVSTAAWCGDFVRSRSHFMLPRSVLDGRRMTWTDIVTTGPSPSPRHAVSIAAYRDTVPSSFVLSCQRV